MRKQLITAARGRGRERARARSIGIAPNADGCGRGGVFTLGAYIYGVRTEVVKKSADFADKHY